MLRITTALWDSNDKSFTWSKGYDESWVEKLYRGFYRNLSYEFEFICYTDRPRAFKEEIKCRALGSNPGYEAYIKPLEHDGPQIVVGLDTVIVGNVDFLAEYAIKSKTLGLPSDPIFPEKACNGIIAVPEGHTHIEAEHNGENDMDWLNKYDHNRLDELFPDKIVSYKKHVRCCDWNPKWSVIYFHGNPKMPDLTKLSWIRDNWV